MNPLTNFLNLKRWELSTSTGSHFGVLDGLRGVAILLVVSYHTLYTNPDHGLLSRVAGYVILAGWMGVPIFFGLSGFLISYPFFKKRSTDPNFWYQRGYAWRRMGKILPPFYLSIAIFFVFYWVQSHDPAYLSSAWKTATGFSYFSSLPINPQFNGVYWSLYLESFFYLSLPFLFWLTRGRDVRSTTLVLWGVLFCAPLLVRYLTWPNDMLALPDHTFALHRMYIQEFNRFPAQADYFAWGVAFAGVYVMLDEVRDKIRGLSLFGYLGLALLAVTLVFWGYWCKHFDIREHPTRWSIEVFHFLPGLATMLLLFFVFDERSLGARVLGCAPLRFTGIISFEWFLFHDPVQKWFHEAYAPSHGHFMTYVWRCLVPLALTIVFAALVYRFFSLPIMRYVRDRLNSLPKSS